MISHHGEEDETELMRNIQNELKTKMAIPQGLPLVSSGYSLKPDMMFGWKPKFERVSGAPIPLYYDFEEFDDPVNKLTGDYLPILYYGYRPKDSLIMHKEFTNKGNSYDFTFPTGNFNPISLPNKTRPAE